MNFWIIVLAVGLGIVLGRVIINLIRILCEQRSLYDLIMDIKYELLLINKRLEKKK